MFTIRGRIADVLPTTTGTSARTGRPWSYTQVVIEVQNGQYTDPYCVQVWNADIMFEKGCEVECDFTIRCNEYNGKWFSSLTAEDIRRISGIKTAGATPAQQQYVQPQQPQPQQATPESFGDLPF